MNARFTGRLEPHLVAAELSGCSLSVMPIIGFGPNVRELTELLGTPIGRAFDPGQEDVSALRGLV